MSNMSKSEDKDAKKQQQQSKQTLAEWITFGTATSVLTVIIGLVIYTGVSSSKQQPPILSVTQKETIREVNGKYYVPFEVVNSGGETVESVQILAELQGKNLEETGEQQIDFLSSQEKEEGAFIFSSDPRQGQLTIRVASYKLP